MSGKGVNGSLDELATGGGRISVTRTRGSAKHSSNNPAPATVNGGAKAKPKARNAEETLPAVPGALEEKRASLLVQKQAELESVHTRHSELIREMFHMENYQLMANYDPIIAQQDNSVVFQAYKTKYDLIEQAASMAGPSRTTRRSHTERRQILAAPTISSLSTASITTPIKAKPKLKSKVVEKTNENPPTPHVGRNKRKGKEKEVILEELAPAHVPAPKPISADLTFETTQLEPEQLISTPQSIPQANDSIIVARRKNGQSRGANVSKTVSFPVSLNREKHGKPVSGVNGYAPRSPASIPDESISAGLARRSVRLKEPIKQTSPPPLATKRKAPPEDHPPPPLPPEITPASPFKFGVKRIKLIVRRPPPALTNPRQRAPPPKFNSSLPKFLASYIAYDEEQDIDEASFLRETATEAEIRERVCRFRADGRFIPGTQTLFGSIPDDDVYIPASRAWKDRWDKVVDEVVARGRTRPRKPHGRHVASQVASKIQGYYDNIEMKRLKAVEAEERRLRNLAKSTMKMVIAEWKKAVYHIREKERLEEEAEELKRGHAHLDAILDQSGQILETQQGDLRRGEMYGSRSRSVSVENLLWGLGEDEDEEEEEDEKDEDDEEDDEAGGEESQEDVQSDDGSTQNPKDLERMDEDQDTSLLLAPPRKASSPTTPTTAISGSPAREGDSQSSTNLPIAPNWNGEDTHMRLDSDSVASLTDFALPEPETPFVRPPLSTPSTSGDDIHLGSPPAQDETPDLFPSNEDLSLADPSTGPGSPADDTPDLGHSAAAVHKDSGGHPIANVLETWSAEVSEHLEGAEVTGLAADNTLLPGSDSVPHNEEPGDEQTNEVMEQEEKEDTEGEADEEEEDTDLESQIPGYLKPYAVAPVEYDPSAKVTHPVLLRGVLRPYQETGLEWLASLHTNRINGILADEMGLGKTIQTIALLAHLACDRGIWGPHLIVVPTSVLLNWEMEFKKFLPGFKILSYHGGTKKRKELRQGWNDKHHFNVCITSYALVTRDAHIFKRKAWYYMILDEAHMIKNFKSQRWNTLLMFRSYRRLLLTGTPLQNNLTELWALLQFLMSGSNFANLKEFGEWFSNPLERAIEMGSVLDDENMQRVSKLHTVLRPYLLRRLKRDVEKELPSKFEHLTLCPLSKRQRFLYDEFMSRAQTREALQSGVYQKIANILMQLRKVCNHPNLFEVRPIVTSFAMQRSVIADFEIKELLVRRRLVSEEDEHVSLELVGLQFINRQNTPLLSAVASRQLDATSKLPHLSTVLGEAPPRDTRTIGGFRNYSAYMQRANTVARWAHIGYLNKLRCGRIPIYSEECLRTVKLPTTIVPFSCLDTRFDYLNHVNRVNQAVKSYITRSQEMALIVDKFAFVTPPVVALDMPHITLRGYEGLIMQQPPDFDEVLHRAGVKLQIAFPDPLLLQYDCGKLQQLAELLREKKAGGHRALIFTQMTRILDILEVFLNFHGYLYLRLDGATKIEDRQYITERFNADPRIFCFISSSRSGGVGINLTGADTVIFYDSDFNPQMDRQCEDRAHRIGQIRDVHIYRFVSQYTVEEAMLRKANQKRSLDDIVIQKGEFDWRTLFSDETALEKALGEFEDVEDRNAAAAALREENSLAGADEADFRDSEEKRMGQVHGSEPATPADPALGTLPEDDGEEARRPADEDDAGAIADYLVRFVEWDYDLFREWRL